MGVGLYLQGRYRAPATKKDPADYWLARVTNWFEGDISADKFWGNFFTRCRRGTAADDHPALFVAIHPAGEEVEFIVPEPGRVTVSAKTSTVGPGYHTALCQLLHRFGDDLKVRWNPVGEDDDSSQDETGYFFTGNRAAVEEEMLLHLKTIAAISADTLKGQGYTINTWHLPLDYDYSEYPGDVHTPVGVRSNKWIRAVAKDPERGRDIYPWWDDGLTAGFYLGRALCDLWTKVRWRPALTGDEYDDWDFVCSDLVEAYKADPSLDYPWREWAELIDILNEFEGATYVTPELEKVIRQRAAKVPKKRPLIGYRRYPVKVNLLDGWSIRIPGEMAEMWEDNTWSAWDGDRTVWFSNWSLTKKDDTPVPAAEVLKAMSLSEGDVIRHRDGKLIGRACLRDTEEDGEELINLQAFSAVNGKAALCNIFYHDENDYDWAVETWHSLTAAANT
jgi:hypothetical protein